jgi:hypothetical protein
MRSRCRSNFVTASKCFMDSAHGVFLVRILVLVGASRGRTGPFFRLPGRGGCLGGTTSTKWGGPGRPAKRCQARCERDEIGWIFVAVVVVLSTMTQHKYVPREHSPRWSARA